MHPRGAELGVVGAVVLLGVGPLVAMLLNAGGDDLLVFAGSDGPFAGDQFQYLSWIREYGRSLLADNDLDLAPSDHVFLHPMFLLSGLGVRLGLSVEAAFLLWKPVAILALLAGCAPTSGASSRSAGADRRARRRAALRLAGGGAARRRRARRGRRDVPGGAAVGLPARGDLGRADAALPARARADGAPARRRVGVAVRRAVVVAAPVAGPGAARHRGGRRPAAAPPRPPWVRSRSPAGRRSRRCSTTSSSRSTDPSWELAAEANEAIGNLPVWSVAVALLPLAAVAALGVRRPESLGEAMLLLWAPSAVLVFLFLSPSFAQHALEGISIPLAVLAVRGLVGRAAPRARRRGRGARGGARHRLSRRLAARHDRRPRAGALPERRRGARRWPTSTGSTSNRAAS